MQKEEEGGLSFWDFSENSIPLAFAHYLFFLACEEERRKDKEAEEELRRRKAQKGP